MGLWFDLGEDWEGAEIVLNQLIWALVAIEDLGKFVFALGFVEF